MIRLEIMFFYSGLLSAGTQEYILSSDMTCHCPQHSSGDNLAHIKRRMAVFIVILNDSGHCPYGQLVELQPFFCGGTMAEAMAKNIKRLETPMKRFLAILDSSQKLLELITLLILCDHNFIWFAIVTAISNEHFSWFEFEIKSCLVSVLYFGIFVSATEDCDIMHCWFLWAVDPAAARLVDCQAKLVLLLVLVHTQQ